MNYQNKSSGVRPGHHKHLLLVKERVKAAIILVACPSYLRQLRVGQGTTIKEMADGRKKDACDASLCFML